MCETGRLPQTSRRSACCCTAGGRGQPRVALVDGGVADRMHRQAGDDGPSPDDRADSADAAWRRQRLGLRFMAWMETAENAHRNKR